MAERILKFDASSKNVENYNEELKMLVSVKAESSQFKYVLDQMAKNKVEASVETFSHLFHRTVNEGQLEEANLNLKKVVSASYPQGP